MRSPTADALAAAGVMSPTAGAPLQLPADIVQLDALSPSTHHFGEAHVADVHRQFEGQLGSGLGLGSIGQFEGQLLPLLTVQCLRD